MNCPRCGSSDPADCKCKPFARPTALDEKGGRQLGLFEGADLARELYGPPPAQRHSDTSRDAALNMEPSAVSLRASCLAHFRRMGDRGATDEEQQRALDMNPSTQRPRRIELCRAGLVVDSGDRRLTEAGRRAVVWIAN